MLDTTRVGGGIVRKVHHHLCVMRSVFDCVSEEVENEELKCWPFSSCSVILPTASRADLSVSTGQVSLVYSFATHTDCSTPRLIYRTAARV